MRLLSQVAKPAYGFEPAFCSNMFISIFPLTKKCCEKLQKGENIGRQQKMLAMDWAT